MQHSKHLSPILVTLVGINILFKLIYFLKLSLINKLILSFIIIFLKSEGFKLVLNCSSGLI